MQDEKQNLKQESKEPVEEQTKEKYGKRPRNKKRMFWTIVVVAAAVAAVVAIVIAVRLTQAEEASRRAYEKLAAETPMATQTIVPAQTPIITDGLQPSDRQIAFDELKKTNEDVIGWIAVPGTQIDYPVMRGIDNDYYINHDMRKEESPMGAIFVDMANNNNWKDPHTVIYGHNMKNGSMFAQLHQFEDDIFFTENNIVKIYVPDGMYVYQIFAAYPTDDSNILYERDFTNINVWKQYLLDVFANKDIKANIDQAASVSQEDRIITLSTCIKDEPDRRYIVQAVLEKSGALS